MKRLQNYKINNIPFYFFLFFACLGLVLVGLLFFGDTSKAERVCFGGGNAYAYCVDVVDYPDPGTIPTGWPCMGSIPGNYNGYPVGNPYNSYGMAGCGCFLGECYAYPFVSLNCRDRDLSSMLAPYYSISSYIDTLIISSTGTDCASQGGTVLCTTNMGTCYPCGTPGAIQSCYKDFGTAAHPCPVQGLQTCTGGAWGDCVATDPTIANCAGKECGGDNGCGGDCGSCPEEVRTCADTFETVTTYSCEANQCITHLSMTDCDSANPTVEYSCDNNVNQVLKKTIGHECIGNACADSLITSEVFKQCRGDLGAVPNSRKCANFNLQSLNITEKHQYENCDPTAADCVITEKKEVVEQCGYDGEYCDIFGGTISCSGGGLSASYPCEACVSEGGAHCQAYTMGQTMTCIPAGLKTIQYCSGGNKCTLSITYPGGCLGSGCSLPVVSITCSGSCGGSGTCTGPSCKCTGPNCNTVGPTCTGTGCACSGPDCGCIGPNCTGPNQPCTGPNCPCVGTDCTCTGPDCACIGPDCSCSGPNCTCEGPNCDCLGPNCMCVGTDCGVPPPSPCTGSGCSCTGSNCTCTNTDCCIGIDCACIGGDCKCIGPKCCIGPGCNCTGAGCDCSGSSCCLGNDCNCSGSSCDCTGTNCCNGSDCTCSDTNCCTGPDCQCTGSSCTCTGQGCCFGPDCSCNSSVCTCNGPNCCTGPDCQCSGDSCMCVGYGNCCIGPDCSCDFGPYSIGCQCNGSDCCLGTNCNDGCLIPDPSNCTCKNGNCCTGSDCDCTGANCTCNGENCCVGADCYCAGGYGCDCYGPDCCMGPDCTCTGDGCYCEGPDCCVGSGCACLNGTDCSCTGTDCCMGENCCTPGTTESCVCGGERTCQADGTWTTCPNKHSDCAGGICQCVDGAGKDLCQVAGSKCQGCDPECECVPGDQISCRCGGQQVCQADGTWSNCPISHSQCIGDGNCGCVPGAGHDECPYDAACASIVCNDGEIEANIGCVNCDQPSCDLATECINGLFASTSDSESIFTLINASTGDITKSEWFIRQDGDSYSTTPDLVCPPGLPVLCSYTPSLEPGNYVAKLKVSGDCSTDIYEKSFRIIENLETDFSCSSDGTTWVSCVGFRGTPGVIMYFKDDPSAPFHSVPTSGQTIASWTWTVNGVEQSEASSSFSFTPGGGRQTIELDVTDTGGRSGSKTHSFMTIPVPRWEEL